MSCKVGLLASVFAFASAISAQADELSVRIGVLTDLSGVYSDFTGQGSVVAANMAAEDFMANNPGMTVEIVSADHLNRPDTAASIAREWYESDGVDAIADMPQSAAALAVSEITRQANRVLLVSGAATSNLTGSACSPNTVHWTYDTWALAHGTGQAFVENGGDSWFFLTADYAFGHALEADTSAVVNAAGGTVAGSVRHPQGTVDFSSYLLQAQASGAEVIGLANAGADTINAIRQASEFGITQSGQSLAGLLVFISDVRFLGLQAAQGLVLSEAFYWDLNDGTRAWSERFAARNDGNMPTMVHAGVYSSVMHYLNSVAAVGTTDAPAAIARMREVPAQDDLFGTSTVREDGRVLHDMYLFRVKSPENSESDWDLYETVATIPAERAFRPISEGGCQLN